MGRQANCWHDPVVVGSTGDAIVDFTLKRVRSGVETLLAANRVSREIRGHLQSQLTGIQARHYDGHDYMVEKWEALDLLVRELTSGAVAERSVRKVSALRLSATR
jgi:Flp pilus assembly protein TadB